jgi:hypothetical protein
MIRFARPGYGQRADRPAALLRLPQLLASRHAMAFSDCSLWSCDGRTRSMSPKFRSRELFSRIMRRFHRPAETLLGYEQPELVDVIYRKTLAYQPSEPWPEIATASAVLDFGGGCGLHYKRANCPNMHWAVVETPAMVERAKGLSTDQLRFFTDISEAAEWLGDIDVMHSNGALQYTPDPISTLNQLCALRARKMLWYRVLFGEGNDVQSSLLGDNGPGPSLRVKEKNVRYERTKIPERNFLDAHSEYEIAERGPDWFHMTRAA